MLKGEGILGGGSFEGDGGDVGEGLGAHRCAKLKGNPQVK
jgi:hypothetical protein